MRTDSVKKYVIPNIPYLFILWACLKLGTAYRLAPGADFAHKLMGLGQSIGPAFADFAPGLAPFDWLIGIVGAVGFRLLIYFKSKNAKKFRRDEEYGSARWGTEKDIKPFVDPKFENNIILTGTELLTINTRPKNPANARNLNACVIGSSGSGKTRFWLTPQLLQAHSSYVCADPKGGVLSQVGAFLQRRGYQVKVFNSIDFSKSMHYNPLSYIHNEADILKFVDTLIANTKGEGKEGDPFWTKAETLLYCALIAYIIFEAPAEDRNINTLVDMISGMDVKEDDESYHVGAGHRHFCFGVWQNVGNLFAYQFGPHPYGNDLPPGGGTDRAELSALPVCRGLPRIAHSGVCCDLCGADPGNCHRRRSHWGDLGHRGLYGFALLHAVQNRDDCAKYL